MLAIVGGLGAAIVFATVTLCNSRSSRMIGPSQLLAWVMLIGLAITAPIVALQGTPDGLDAESGVWLVVAGVGNVVGLLLAYAALRLGKVGIVAPMVSTQGAIAAVIAVIAGESLGTATGIVLGFIALGISWPASRRSRAPARRSDPRDPPRSTPWARRGQSVGACTRSGGRVSSYPWPGRWFPPACWA